MNKLEELSKLAESVKDKPWDFAKGIPEGDFIAAANPQTILALLDLIELQHEGLHETYKSQDRWPEIVIQAFDAYDKFKEQL